MRRLGLVLIMLLAPAVGRAQEFSFYEHGPYREIVPRPSSILGYEPGEFHTDYGNMLKVTDAIAAAAADRVRIVQYGTSTEGRPLRLIIVSSPANIERLGEIRANILRLRDPRSTSAAQAAEIAAATPAIGWLNYANDGNETAAFEAAIMVAYQLAAAEDEMTLAILENTVAVINSAHNPESHGRHVEWYNAFAVGDSAHDALEHDAPWGMSTNNNHYQIDLNRDALAISQRETRAIVQAHHDWSPQVFVDHHGQTTQFFMPPPMLPLNPSLPKDWVLRWTDVYGQGNAAAFDRYGWNYFVRDVFDLHYPGYWDSWPALNGAIGMTYETDGGGYRGYAWVRDDGTVLTFADGIAKHFAASLATMSTLAENREAALRDYHEFFRSGMNQFAASKPWKRFVITPGSDPERAARLVEILLRDDVEVGVATQPFSSGAAHDYVSRDAMRREFPAGSYIIDLAQPQARLVDALLAPDADIDPEFVERQAQRRARNARRGANVAKEWYQFYDITGWSLPLSFGVDAYWLESAGQIAARPLEVEFNERDAAWRPPAYLGVRDLSLLPEALRSGIEGGVRGGRARTAYVFRYDRNASARLAFALMKEGFKVAAAAQPMRARGTTYPRGTLVLRVNRNPETLHERIDALASRFGVPVDAVNTGYYEEGATGIGSNPIVTLQRPRVALAAGEGVSATSFGATWYTLDREFGVPFTALRLENLAGSLDDFNVIVLPSGWGYRRAFGDGETLRQWIRDGGVVVAMGSASGYFVDAEITSARLVGEDEDDDDDADQERQVGLAQAAYSGGVITGGTEDAPIRVPGAIMRATLDLTHPLTFGYENQALAVLVSGDDFYHPSKEGANPVAFVGDDLRIAGYEWPDNTEEFLQNTAWMVDEPIGSGRLILFADEPTFRLLWKSLDRLFLNGILFGPTIR